MLAPALSFFLVTLAAASITPALPTVDDDLSAGTALGWVITAHSLAFAALLVPAGAWSDRIGARRGFLLGLAGHTITAAICALAPGPTVLLAARVLQGASAALLLPAGLALLDQAGLGRRERVAAVGRWSAAGSVALVAGAPVGGAITAAFGWRAVFWLLVPFGLACLWLVPATASPLVQPRAVRLGSLLRIPAVLVSLVLGFLVNFCVLGVTLALSIDLQRSAGHSALVAGLALIPMTGLVIPASLLAGRVLLRYGTRRTLLTGLALMTAGIAGVVAGWGALVPVVAATLPIGVGSGLVIPSMTGLLLDAVPARRSGLGSGLLNASRQAGSGLAAVVIAPLL